MPAGRDYAKENAARRAKYQQARQAGLSAKDARLLRGYTQQKITTKIQFEQERKQPRQIRTQQTDKQIRHARFRKWSASKKGNITRSNFPSSYQRKIDVWNADNRTPFGSFGYKVFYYWYVEGFDADEALDIAESTDS